MSGSWLGVSYVTVLFSSSATSMSMSMLVYFQNKIYNTGQVWYFYFNVNNQDSRLRRIV